MPILEEGIKNYEPPQFLAFRNAYVRICVLACVRATVGPAEGPGYRPHKGARGNQGQH